MIELTENLISNRCLMSYAVDGDIGTMSRSNF